MPMLAVLIRSRLGLLLVNTTTCCAVSALGDICQQRISRGGPNDWARTGRMAVLGACLGPVTHYWYLLLDVVLPGTRVVTVVKKVLADQLLMAPVNYFIFYTGNFCCCFVVVASFIMVIVTAMQYLSTGCVRRPTISSREGILTGGGVYSKCSNKDDKQIIFICRGAPVRRTHWLCCSKRTTAEVLANIQGDHDGVKITSVSKITLMFNSQMDWLVWPAAQVLLSGVCEHEILI